MTATAAVMIRCDFRATPVAHRCGVELETSERLAKAARAEAREEGWDRRYAPSSCGYDLCPDHGAQVPGETFPDWRKLPRG